MTAGRYDITLDGNQYRLVRKTDLISYRRRWERRQIFSQDVPAQQGVMFSRGDRGVMYQTDWSDGRSWWLPLLGPDTIRMYGDSAAWDAFTKPGTILPTNKSYSTSAALHEKSPFFSTIGGLYGIGNTKTIDSTYWDVVKFNGSDWAVQAGYSCGVADTSIFGIAYDSANAYAYVMGDSYISRFKTSGTQNSNWQALSPSAKAGDTIFVTNTGLIFVYHEGKIKKLDTSGPSLTDIVDDGFGPDLMSNMTAAATPHLQAVDLRLAVAHSSGIYYAKNVMADGLPVCYISRIDRDQSGSYIRYPLTTLPPGMVALNVTVHLGSVIIAATRDWQMALANDRTTAEYPIIDFYAYTQGGGLTPLGSPNRERPSEIPARFIGADADYLYIGSNKKVWVYDASRGGIHPWLQPATLTSGVYQSIAPAVLSNGTQVLMLKLGVQPYYYHTHSQDPTTVASFDTDLSSYVFTSNYFDFGVPMEAKTLTALDVMTESASASQQFTIQISVDDGSWTTVKKHSNATFTTTDLSASSYTGYRFRYRVIYETKAAALVGVRGIQFSGAWGQMIPVWELVLDGTNIRNVENEVVVPETAYDNLETSAVKEIPVTLIDNFRSERVEDTGSYTVTITSLEIQKSDPNEAMFRVQLTGEP